MLNSEDPKHKQTMLIDNNISYRFDSEKLFLYTRSTYL